jgi:hypothetical protein
MAECDEGDLIQGSGGMRCGPGAESEENIQRTE